MRVENRYCRHTFDSTDSVGLAMGAACSGCFDQRRRSVQLILAYRQIPLLQHGFRVVHHIRVFLRADSNSYIGALHRAQHTVPRAPFAPSFLEGSQHTLDLGPGSGRVRVRVRQE